MCIGTLGAIGAVASAQGTLFQGISSSEAANYQAQVQRNNAKIANQNAQRAIAAGQQQAQNQNLKNAATAGAIKTGLAANNIDVNSGSALDLEASQRAKGQLDTENTLYNSEIQAYGYRVNATSDTGQAQLEEATAQNAPIGAGLATFGGLLSNDKFTGWGKPLPA
ncbi:MAG: hypothetical protein WAL59_07520 [Roseiarcus sp.]